MFNSRTIDTRGRGDEVEILLVIDASGSMNSRTGTSKSITFGSCKNSLFTATMAVSRKIFFALRNAGVSTQVVAHTSTSNDGGRSYLVPMVYKVASFGACGTTSNPDKKFDATKNIELAENYDGLVLRSIAENTKEYFSDNPNSKKIVIVLSDGEPSSRDYMGSDAVANTKAWANELRNRGFEVEAVSLVSTVVRSNDTIYGEEHNVDATSDLDSALTKMVTRMASKK